MRLTRVRSGLLAGVFLAALVGCVFAMAQRVKQYNSEQGRKLWVFQAVDVREFKLGDRPVSITDTTGADGSDLVLIKYGDRELKLTVPMKIGDAKLPGLFRHVDWLRVQRFAELGQRSGEEFKQHLEDSGEDRLVIVARRPLTGPDPRTGDVWQRDWMFDFHELKRDGTIDTSGLKFPKTRGDKQPKPGELRAGTWQMDAALYLMPQTPPDSLNVGRPTAAFRGDAMKSMGWTLPAAALATIGLVVCLVMAAMPRRQKSLAS